MFTMFFSNKKRENRIAFAYYAVANYESLKKLKPEINFSECDEHIYYFFRCITDLNYPSYPYNFSRRGISLASNLDHCIAYIMQGKTSIIGSYMLIDHHRKKYDEACYLAYLCATTLAYHFADQDLPIKEEEKDFFCYCYKKVGLDEHEKYSEHFCLRTVREDFAKILWFKIQNLP